MLRQIRYSEHFQKQFNRLPSSLQKKFIKQLTFLLENQHHPSLRCRKMADGERFEARIDRHYRFTFILATGEILFLTVGPHDEGLGKR